MSYPYITDALNAIFGTHWHLPVPTFGVIVAIAVVLATYVANRIVRSYEQLGRLPSQSHAIVSDMAIISIAPCGNVPHSAGPDYFTFLCIDPLAPPIEGPHPF